MTTALHYSLPDYWNSGYAEYDSFVNIYAEIHKVSPSAVIELFELQLNTTIHGSNTIYRYHAGTDITGANGNVVWAGNTYQALPIEADGFEYSGTGQLPRPKIRVSNALGTISALILVTPLEGAKVTRIRTLVRYIDAVNFSTRRNLLITTDSFTSSWAYGTGLGSFFTVTSSSVHAPDGNLTALQFVSTATTSQGLFLRATQSQTAATYNISIYIYVPAQTGVTNWSVAYDAQDSADNATTAVQTLFNQWVRVSIPITYTATRTFLDFNIRRNGVAPSAAGFTFHAWGAQLELGTTATTYQPIGTTWSQNPYGTPDITAEFPREVYVIDRKSAETRDVVEYELSAVFDLVGVRAPRRQCVSNICQWEYRSAECGYQPDGPAARPLREHYVNSGYNEGRNINSGGQFNASYYLALYPDVAAQYNVSTANQHFRNYGIWEGRSGNAVGPFNATYYLSTYPDLKVLVYFNENDQGVTDQAFDVCGKRLSSCKARFGATAQLPFGSYPGIGTYFT